MEYSTENVQPQAWEYSTPGPRYLSLVSLAPLFVLHLLIPNLFWVFLLLLFRGGLRRTVSPCLIRGQLPVPLVGQREKDASSDCLDFATLSCCPRDLFVWFSNTVLNSCTGFPLP